MKDASGDEQVGLCAGCRHARSSQSRRGGKFWRCAAADRDPSLPRYPPLPVRECGAFDPGPPER